MILSDTFLSYLTTGLIILLALFFALWVSLVIWAYRDMRSRSRDVFAQTLSAIVVALLPVVGILIYLILRPAETLSEAFERSLAEEALLQEIEKKPYCPGCSRRVHPDWQICPYCHTRLKKPCAHCANLIELHWTICPFCAAPQQPAEAQSAGDSAAFTTGTVEPDPALPDYQEDEPGIWTISD